MTVIVCHGVLAVCIVGICAPLGAGLRNPDNAQERSRARVDRLARERYGREQARKVIVTTMLVKPYMMLKPPQPNSFPIGNDRFEGFIADILQRLARTGRFPYEIRLARDWQIGRPGENGSWTGIIGEVMRGEADIGAAPVTPTRVRQAAVAFSRPFLDDVRTAALIRIPLNPDENTSENKNKDDDDDNDDDDVERGIPDNHPIPVRYIRSPEDLRDSDLLYGVVRESVVQTLFHRSHEYMYQRMWARMTTFWPSVFVSSIEEGVLKARREPYAFLLDSAMADYQATRRPCDLYRTDQFQPARGYAFALRHGAETDRGGRLMSAINAELTRLKETGELRALYAKWWKDECARDVRRTVVGHEGRLEITTVVNPWRQATASHRDSNTISSQNCLNVNLLLLCSSLLVMFR